jgi:hypothetical protein
VHDEKEDSNLLDNLDNFQGGGGLIDDLLLSSVRSGRQQEQILSRQHMKELIDMNDAPPNGEGAGGGTGVGLESELADNYIDDGGNFIYGTQDMSEANQYYDQEEGD